MSKPTGYVIYEGPSLLDGEPIVCVVTLKSRNKKTGAMRQTWIMRSDVSPVVASRLGLDKSNCGTCPLRGIAQPQAKRGQAKQRKCYVVLAQAPTSIWHAYKRGSYPVASGHAAIAAIGRGRMVRLGAYGDQSAVPGYIAESLLSEAAGHTAYSHQSNDAGSSFDASRFMVSADSLAAAQVAWSRGQRTFRVLRPDESAVQGREIPCPSPRVHCIDCGLCKGASKAKSIVIPAHGSGARWFA